MTRVIVAGRGEDISRQLADRLRKVTELVLAAELEGLADRCEVGITLVGAAEIRELNEAWRDQPGATDVLSFPLYEDMSEVDSSGPVLLGDVVICPSMVTADPGEDSLAQIARVAAHGVLHLLGYDHAAPEDEATMFALQERYAEEAARG